MVLADRVQETTTTTGTGTITLGGAVTGFQSFSNIFTNGTLVTYTMAGGSEWEVGEGTYSAGTLTRTTIFSSSNSNALVNFSAGTKAIFCDMPAAQLNSLINIFNSINGLRLTISTNTPLPLADVSSSTTIYLTPYSSGSIGLYYNNAWRIYNTAEISLAVGTKVANTNYDIFAYYTGSAVALEYSNAWTNNTTRSQALGKQDGVLIKASDAHRRYIGTVRTISTTTVTDTAIQRFIYNEYNQIERFLLAFDTADNWTYNSNTWRQANGLAKTTNKIEFVCGSPVAFSSRVEMQVQSTSINTTLQCSLGFDSITGVFPSARLLANTTGVGYICEMASGDDVSPIGYHYIAWLERVVGTITTQTAFGSSAGGNQSHIRARIRM